MGRQKDSAAQSQDWCSDREVMVVLTVALLIWAAVLAGIAYEVVSHV